MKIVRNILLLIGLCVSVGVGLWAGSEHLSSLSIASATVTAQTSDGGRFRLLRGGFRGEYATYTFQTPPEEKNYADDCIGCELEVGNAVIYAEFGCPKKSKYLFDSNSEGGIAEKMPILDVNGSKIAEVRLIVFKDGEKVRAARLFWIEGQNFWFVQAPTVALTKALKASEEYKSVRKKVAEEIKSYVPIKNANTLVKKPC